MVISLEGKSLQQIEEYFEKEASIFLGTYDHQSFLAFCVDFELEVLSLGIQFNLRYHLHLLLLLIRGELENARFLWKRIPPASKASNPQLEVIWGIGQSMWKREFNQVFAKASEFEGDAFSETLVVCLVDQYRDHVFSLIAQSYSSLSSQSCARMIGLSIEETIAKAEKNGWELQENGTVLKPKRKGEGGKEAVISPEVLQKLTSYVTYLEDSVGFK